MHPIIGDHPVHKQHTADLAAAASQRDRLVAEVQGQTDAWHAVQRQAFATGKPVPDPPSGMRTVRDVYDGHDQTVAELNRRYEAWLDDNAAELFDRFEACHSEILERACQLADARDALVAESKQVAAWELRLRRATGADANPLVGLDFDGLVHAGRAGPPPLVAAEHGNDLRVSTTTGLR